MKICPWPDVVHRLAQVITQVLRGGRKAYLSGSHCIAYHPVVLFIAKRSG
jgi:hypothetical protein